MRPYSDMADWLECSSCGAVGIVPDRARELENGEIPARPSPPDGEPAPKATPVPGPAHRVEIEPDRRPTGIMQYGLFGKAPAGIWTARNPHSVLPLMPGPLPDMDAQLMLFGEPATLDKAPPLMLADAAGFTALQPGRSARNDKRVLIYSLLKVPLDQRRPGGRYELREPGWRIARELWAPTPQGQSSYRPGKHGRALTQAFDALSLAKVRLADGALWRPAVTRQSPNPYDLDTDYIIEFRFPDDCARGALVHRPSLIAAGMHSDPAFDLCLSMAYLWDEAKARNGGFHIYATRPMARRDRDGNLLDREGNVIMGAPGSPRMDRAGKLTWPAKGRGGAQAAIKDWRHPGAIIDGTERHPAADKVRELGPDERRKLAFGDRSRIHKPNASRDRKTADSLLLRLEAEGRIVIEAPRNAAGIPLSRFEWRILPVPWDAPERAPARPARG